MPFEMIIKKVISIVEYVGELKPFMLLLEIQNDATTMENTMEVTPKTGNTISSSNPTSGHLSKRIEVRILKRSLQSVFTVALFTRDRIQKQPLTDEWIRKCVYTQQNII
jgi:hypothetical protein